MDDDQSKGNPFAETHGSMNRIDWVQSSKPIDLVLERRDEIEEEREREFSAW